MASVRAMERRRGRSIGLLAILLLAFGPIPGSAGVSAQAATVLTEGTPRQAEVSAAGLDVAFAFVQSRVDRGLFPGAVVLVARHGIVVGSRAFGVMERGSSEPMTTDAIFDQESITKVLSTAPVVLALVEDGTLALNDPVARYLPDFAVNGKEAITIREMLAYSAGLPGDAQSLENPDDAAVWKEMAETPLEYQPRTMVEYSDLTYRLLGRVIEAATGRSLADVAREKIWAPLGMTDTMYNPPASLTPRIAGTGYSELRGRTMRGEVADEQDYALGGVAGCDGVFSSARDLAILGQTMLNGGSYGDASVLSADTVVAMTANQTPWVDAATTDTDPLANLLFTPKGYGWELATPRFSHGGTKLTEHAYGKAGGAGTFMWVDPATDLVAVYLTNHGLPVPFDEAGWNDMLDRIAPDQFFNLVATALDPVPVPPAGGTPPGGTPATGEATPVAALADRFRHA